MGFHNRNSAIRFLKIDPLPSEIIPGGTIVEEVVVPWIGQPIGTIVNRPSDKPPDPFSRGRVRTLWYFISAGSVTPSMVCDTLLEDIHIRVRDSYRRIYDHRNAPRGSFIASGDDDEIVDKVIEWAGLSEKWVENDLYERHDFWREVLMECYNVQVKTREWEGGGPGLSGVWYSVRSMNPSELRKEIGHWFEVMVERDKVELEQSRVLAGIKKAKRLARKKEHGEKQ